MILLIFLVCTTHPTLIYQYDAYSNIIDGWEDETHVCSFETCGQIHFFGTSFNDEIKISRIFLNLEPHSHIKVEAEFLKQLFIYNKKSIDDTYISNFMIDEELTQYESKMLFQICGDENPEYLQTISIVRLHNRRSVWIYIQTYYGGLISFRLSILKCSDLCVGCIDNYHKFCQSWKLHQYSFNQKSITNYDGWTLISVLNQNINLFNCGDCQFIIFQEINFFTKLPPHEDVLIRFFKLFTNPIIIDYLESQQTISFENQIEILLRNHHNPILQLNIKTQSNSDFGFIRDFELYYTQPELMFNNLNEGCLEQFQDKCLNCQEGWILDEFQENCHPICGDGIIHGQEQCDYGNLISKYSCHLCKYSCIDFCKICQFGICLQCQDGFIINGNFICDPLCGDGNLIPYSTEQCEISVNGVNGVQDGCLDCKFISIENCKTNHFSICLECEVGFDILESICFPHCGDKLILKQYEDCDDGNLQPYDGCFECKFQCIEDCKTCEKGQCIQICEDGYEYVNNSCLSVCGDQIVTKEEDCDDGNLQPWDGCFLCKYSCPQYCYDCYQGICLECYYQYQLLNSNQCKQQLNCGDGYLQEQEECDDGNYEALDGCKDCLIELNWICITIIKDSPSQCTFVKAPNLIINYLNITQNKQYISIQFNQGVKINTTQLLSKTINYVLENISQKNWKGSLFIIQDVGSDVNFGEYIISIETNLENLTKPDGYQYRKCCFIGW
ncbi:unnamed protein product [Paramecium sonneborni]|uniref:Insulin-like growth factor binding protein, N-terminal n=1 Tax=Paramecium sonneborni TaxID=65129 RepID=A0A8S1R5T9_9CILI|nr:unnamed protein product [Paramecium sonneborni]